MLFHVLRFLARSCNGSACDWFTPVSLVLPLLILVLIALTGLAALPAASRRRPGTTWPLAIGVSTVLGVLGPVVSLLIFRDNPDQFVAIATALVALLPIVVLTYELGTRASP